MTRLKQRIAVALRNAAATLDPQPARRDPVADTFLQVVVTPPPADFDPRLAARRLARELRQGGHGR